MGYRTQRITDRFKYERDKERKQERTENRNKQHMKLWNVATFSWIGKSFETVQNPIFMSFVSTIATFLAAYFCFGLVWWKFGLIASAPYILQLSIWLIRKFVLNVSRMLKWWDRFYDWCNRKNSGLE